MVNILAASWIERHRHGIVAAVKEMLNSARRRLEGNNVAAGKKLWPNPASPSNGDSMSDAAQKMSSCRQIISVHAQSHRNRIQLLRRHRHGAARNL